MQLPGITCFLVKQYLQAASCTKSLVKLMYQTCLGKYKNQKDSMIHGIPTCVNCGAFYRSTSTVAVGDWICKTYSEVSQNKSECVKMKHVQHCIHFLLVTFKRVIFFPLG